MKVLNGPSTHGTFDGDGLETLGINTASPVLFDLNADGIKTATGWIKSCWKVNGSAKSCVLRPGCVARKDGRAGRLKNTIKVSVLKTRVDLDFE